MTDHNATDSSRLAAETSSRLAAETSSRLAAETSSRLAAETNVVVIGGGYAGTTAANHLRMRTDVNITLVNPRPKFVERIRLHQHAAGNYDATVDYGTLLGEGVELVVDNATRIRHRSPQSRACIWRRAGLRPPDLRGRQHRCGSVVGTGCSRIRLPHR